MALAVAMPTAPQRYGRFGRWRAVRDLFHRNHPVSHCGRRHDRRLQRRTSPHPLCAAIAGLARERPGDAAVNSGLREIVCSETGLGVPKLARETGVSIARFERLVELVAAADAEDGAPLPGITGTALILRLLWMRSTTRRELWTYLTTLDARHDVLCSTAGVDAAAAFEAMPRFTADELSGPSVEAAAKLLFQPEPGGDDTAVATAFETLAAALANGGSRAPPLNQGRYGYEGLPAVADCAELDAHASFSMRCFGTLRHRRLIRADCLRPLTSRCFNSTNLEGWHTTIRVALSAIQAAPAQRTQNGV